MCWWRRAASDSSAQSGVFGLLHLIEVLGVRRHTQVAMAIGKHVLLHTLGGTSPTIIGSTKNPPQLC